jgi:(2Fe-2S) ferredoxin
MPPRGLWPRTLFSNPRIALMSFYQHHVFFCCNQREGGKACCNDYDAIGVRDYAKSRIKELGLAGKGQVRINMAGCLDRCEEGPVLVVYPEEVWYTYVDREDIDEIISEHLQNGRIVERLKI